MNGEFFCKSRKICRRFIFFYKKLDILAIKFWKNEKLKKVEGGIYEHIIVVNAEHADSEGI